VITVLCCNAGIDRTYAVDDNYMFSVTHKVENTGTAPVTLYPYALVSRWGTPKTQDIYILHEGALGVLDGTLKEMKYKALREEDHQREEKSTGGWIGFTDKYWLTALVPDQSMAISARMNWRSVEVVDRYQADWLGSALTVAPGSSTARASSTRAARWHHDSREGTMLVRSEKAVTCYGYDGRAGGGALAGQVRRRR